LVKPGTHIHRRLFEVSIDIEGHTSRLVNDVADVRIPFPMRFNLNAEQSGRRNDVEGRVPHPVGKFTGQSNRTKDRTSLLAVLTSRRRTVHSSTIQSKSSWRAQ